MVTFLDVAIPVRTSLLRCLAFVLAAGALAFADEPPLPEGAILRLRATGAALDDFPVLAVAVSPDGKTVATGALNGDVRLWGATDGREGRRLAGRGPVRALAWLPDSKTLLIVDRDGVRGWDGATGRERFAVADKDVVCLTVAPEGTGFLVGGAGVLSYDASGKRVSKPLRSGSVRGVALASGGRWAAAERAEVVERDGFDLVRLNGRVHLWSTHTGGRPESWSEKDDISAAVAFALDGSVLADGGSAGVVRFRDALTGKVFARSDGVRDVAVTSLATSPDGLVVAGGLASLGETAFLDEAQAPGEPLLLGERRPDAGNRVVLWEACSGKELGGFETGGRSVTSVTFLPDGRHLAVGLVDGTALIYAWKSPEYRAERIERLDRCWEQLGAAAPEGIQAALDLAALPGAVQFLSDHLKTVGTRARSAAARVRDLRDGDRKQRTEAVAELRTMAELVEPALRAALDVDDADDAALKIKIILLDLALEKHTPEGLRLRRGLLILERLRTKEAKSALEALARTECVPLLSREAKAAANRLTALEKVTQRSP